MKIRKALLAAALAAGMVLTGIGEGYIFASIILISSMAMQYISVQFADARVSNNDLFLYSIIAAPVIGAVLGCLAAGKLSGDGLPAAKDITSGSVSDLNISLIADGFNGSVLSEKTYSMQKTPANTKIHFEL